MNTPSFNPGEIAAAHKLAKDNENFNRCFRAALPAVILSEANDANFLSIEIVELALSHATEAARHIK